MDDTESAESEHVCERLLLGRVCATVFIKPAVTRDRFDIQVSTGVCSNSNAL